MKFHWDLYHFYPSFYSRCFGPTISFTDWIYYMHVICWFQVTTCCKFISCSHFQLTQEYKIFVSCSHLQLTSTMKYILISYSHCQFRLILCSHFRPFLFFFQFIPMPKRIRREFRIKFQFIKIQQQSEYLHC